MTKRILSLLTLMLSLLVALALASCDSSSNNNQEKNFESETKISKEDWVSALALEGFDSYSADYTHSFKMINMRDPNIALTEEATGSYTYCNGESFESFYQSTIKPVASETAVSGFDFIEIIDSNSKYKNDTSIDFIECFEFSGYFEDFFEVFIEEYEYAGFSEFIYDEKTGSYQAEVTEGDEKHWSRTKGSIYFNKDKLIEKIVIDYYGSEGLYDRQQIRECTETYLFSNYNSAPNIASIDSSILSKAISTFNNSSPTPNSNVTSYDFEEAEPSQLASELCSLLSTLSPNNLTTYQVELCSRPNSPRYSVYYITFTFEEDHYASFCGQTVSYNRIYMSVYGNFASISLSSDNDSVTFTY